MCLQGLIQVHMYNIVHKKKQSENAIKPYMDTASKSAGPAKSCMPGHAYLQSHNNACTV